MTANNLCSVTGCDKPTKSRGWCEMHYTRWRNNGDPSITRRPTLGMSPEERFWLYVDKASEGCWMWTGVRDEKGYGRHHIGRKPVKAHRYSYELLVGPIPPGLVIDHLCRVTSCVNPDHLEPVTGAENTRRGNSVKEACPQGHPYNERNSLKFRASGRVCRECNRLRSARWRAARAAAS